MLNIPKLFHLKYTYMLNVQYVVSTCHKIGVYGKILSHAIKLLWTIYILAIVYQDISTLSQATNLDFSKLKVPADDNFKFDKNSKNLSKWVQNTVGKGEIACYEQFLLFQQCF